MGEQRLFAWRPLPPSARFVALGTIVTTGEDAPPPECVHCVPLRWVLPSASPPTRVWDDAGSGGPSCHDSASCS